MTDRVNYLTVVVKDGLREDDALQLIAAISQFKDVVSVGYDIVNASDYAAASRARNELISKVLDAIRAF